MDKKLHKVFTNLDMDHIEWSMRDMIDCIKATIRYVEDRYELEWQITKPLLVRLLDNHQFYRYDGRATRIFDVRVKCVDSFNPYEVTLVAYDKDRRWNTQYLSTNYRASSLFDKAIMDYFKRDEDMLNTLVPTFIKTNKEVSELINFDVANSIKEVIYNDPATIVFWNDGTKTVVKCGEDDTYNPETGLAMCIVKKITGNKGNYNNVFRKWVK